MASGKQGSGNSARKARELARAQREAEQAAAKRRRTMTTAVIAVVVVAIVAGLGGLVAWQRNKTDTDAAAPNGVVPAFTATASPAASTTASPSPSASSTAAQSTREPNQERQSTSTAPGMGWGVGAGKSTAPVTLELFEDFSCPHCADLESDLGDKLKPSIADGSVKVIYYPMTLPGFGRPTELAANAFACAADAGKTEEFHDALFANYQTAAQQWTNSMLTDIGKSVGLTSNDFSTCVRGDQFAEWVKSIDDTGDDREVSGTPSAFVNGQRLAPEQLSGDGIMAAIASAALASKK